MVPVSAVLAVGAIALWVTVVVDGVAVLIAFITACVALVLSTCWSIVGQASRADVLADGLRLTRPRGPVEIPWGALRRVEGVQANARRWRLTWDGGRVVSFGRFADEPTLVAAIRRHAPQADLPGP